MAVGPTIFLAAKVIARGYKIGNLDCIVFAEHPKLSPHKKNIQQRIAEILRLSADQIGIKAKTGEGLGDLGRQESIMAQCIALLESPTEN